MLASLLKQTWYVLMLTRNKAFYTMLKKKCDANVAQTIELAKQMIQLAQKGDEHREDPGCGVLYGILLDSGYRILDLALKEKNAHISKGWWDDDPGGT